MMKFEPQKFDVLVFPFIKKGDVVQLFKGMNRFLTSYFSQWPVCCYLIVLGDEDSLKYNNNEHVFFEFFW